ncbi:M23 family metallopeptidase [Arsenicibacter rosenii]|uniref:Peptidase M23 n=1 Tax=Arsenicibacter rosenii TaxID=1750698 RepID=A0A1S2VK18_9BACT|nr:M23 family metallopeptidase [Arsenicibacter rosenii]OIN58565.1 peptidase M23 [Arsenicibacter rosenii]
MKNRSRYVLLHKLVSFAVPGAIVLLQACNGVGPATGLFRSTSPHEQYEQSLKSAKLDRTALGIDWLDVAQRALRDSLQISIPYRESGYFAAGRPFAVGYRLNAQRGDKLIIRVDIQGQKEGQVFIDVFELDDRAPANRPNLVVSSKADTNQLEWEVRRTRMHLIRIQPELLRSGRYTIAISREPLLSFPVQGRTSRQISSFFGASRDGGQRRHEGVDIFAPRGTPALAVTDGIISRVGVNELGGNIVFLSDNARNQRLYYAHLDRWHVTDGQRVSTGDTVGFVGNTGNARTTGPHLHFGIYSGGEGAVDPLPFIRLGSGPARQPLLAAGRLGDSVRVAVNQAFLRNAPHGDGLIVRSLPKTAALTILGGTADWLRVALPDGITGYLSNNAVETAARSLRQLTLNKPTDLVESAVPSAAVVDRLPAGAVVDVLGAFNGYQLIRQRNRMVGWIRL